MSVKVRKAFLIMMVIMLAAGYGLFRILPFAFRGVELLRFAESSTDDFPVSRWMSYSEGYLAELRDEFALESLVADAVSDIERVASVTEWVHGLWKHDGRNTPSESHPLYILRAVAEGERFRCVEYGVVITGCLQALGIPARTLGLKMQDVETRASGAGHVVTEAYLRDLQKWVMVDGQWNAIPFEGDTPLNAVELEAAIALRSRGLTFPMLGTGTQWRYRAWIKPYLHFFDVNADGVIIMLAPEGALKPTVFQQKWPLRVDMLIHTVGDFYAAPSTH